MQDITDGRWVTHDMFGANPNSYRYRLIHSAKLVSKGHVQYDEKSIPAFTDTNSVLSSKRLARFQQHQIDFGTVGHLIIEKGQCDLEKDIDLFCVEQKCKDNSVVLVHIYVGGPIARCYFLNQSFLHWPAEFRPHKDNGLIKAFRQNYGYWNIDFYYRFQTNELIFTDSSFAKIVGNQRILKRKMRRMAQVMWSFLENLFLIFDLSSSETRIYYATSDTQVLRQLFSLWKLGQDNYLRSITYQKF